MPCCLVAVKEESGYVPQHQTFLLCFECLLLSGILPHGFICLLLISLPCEIIKLLLDVCIHFGNFSHLNQTHHYTSSSIFHDLVAILDKMTKISAVTSYLSIRFLGPFFLFSFSSVTWYPKSAIIEYVYLYTIVFEILCFYCI